MELIFAWQLKILLLDINDECQGFGWSADGIVTDHITKMNDEDYDDFLMEDLAQELEVK